jgi:hypothetical protein
MFRRRQSSFPETTPAGTLGAEIWGHCRGAVAFSGASHGERGRGGFHRRSPSGGAAYGIPR